MSAVILFGVFSCCTSFSEEAVTVSETFTCPLSVHKDNQNQLLLVHRMPAVQGITAQAFQPCRDCWDSAGTAQFCSVWLRSTYCVTLSLLWRIVFCCDRALSRPSQGFFWKLTRPGWRNAISFPSLNMAVSVEVLCESLHAVSDTKWSHWCGIRRLLWEER